MKYKEPTALLASSLYSLSLSEHNWQLSCCCFQHFPSFTDNVKDINTYLSLAQPLRLWLRGEALPGQAERPGERRANCEANTQHWGSKNGGEVLHQARRLLLRHPVPRHQSLCWRGFPAGSAACKDGSLRWHRGLMLQYYTYLNYKLLHTRRPVLQSV